MFVSKGGDEERVSMRDPESCNAWGQMPDALAGRLDNQGLRVKYIGLGATDKDAACVRAIQAANSSVNYFEIQVLDRGRNGFIGIGFSGPSAPLNRLPGWEANTYGYHGDDGHKFHDCGRGLAYGPTFGKGDVIGAALDRQQKTISFTRNGVDLGVAFCNVAETELYPVVGLRTPNEEVEANFGSCPFKTDIACLSHQGYTGQDLRDVSGNSRCADCNAIRPDYGSLIWGTFLCADCASIHSSLSLSMTESYTCNVECWNAPAVVEMMASLGNHAVNSVLEKNIAAQLPRESEVIYKPTPISRYRTRLKFIRAKYVFRGLVRPKHSDNLQIDLVHALRADNLRKAMKAVARGADVAAPLRLQFADTIMQEANAIHPPLRPDNYLRSESDIETSLIFAACKDGSPKLWEFLVQNGADLNAKDSQGRTPLHYAAILSRPELVQYLVNKGADRTSFACRSLMDTDEQTAYDVAVALRSFDHTVRLQLCPPALLADAWSSGWTLV